MSFLICSNGHPNPADSHFCRICGEQMVTQATQQEAGEESKSPASSPAPPQKLLVGQRYRLIQQIGHGGFGRTYLAVDEQRFQEQCVLKEFAPKVEGIEALRKAEDLFEREAGVLYRLRHPQIPRFRELLRTNFEGSDRLFLVQDFVDGPTYQDRLEHRLQDGKYFSEPEILEFLSQILPVLDYIHRMGVIHRDISPDNLIYRREDEIPILIDFGGVKQAAMTIESKLRRSQYTTPEVTLVGKQGFAPQEQLQDGRVKPHSDLYALAVTVLVLMTGQAPRDFLDRDALTYWEKQFDSHGGMGALLHSVLSRMLSDRPETRYPSAQHVLDALGLLRLTEQSPQTTANSPNPIHNVQNTLGVHRQNRPQSTKSRAHPPQPVATAHTVAVAPKASHPPQSQKTLPTSNPPVPRLNLNQPDLPQPAHSGAEGLKGIIAFFLIVSLAGVGGWVGYRWVPQWLNLDQSNHSTSNPAQIEESGGDLDTKSSQFSQKELNRKNALRSRRDALEVDASFLIKMTDASFYNDYPQQRSRNLTDGPDDAIWRERWDAIASKWLDTLEETLSVEARRKLGRYGQSDLLQWKQSINQLYVSSAALYDLADAQFFHTFPDQQNQNFIDQPIGQIWYGLASDQARAMQANKNLKDIHFAAGAASHEIGGELQPGAGQVYTLNLSENQVMDLTVDAPRGSLRLSIYVPRPTDKVPLLLEDSRSLNWSGSLPQSGYYEVVIVSVSDRPIDFQLNVSVEYGE